MKITIRPAPHSKGCAWAGRTWCSKFDDEPQRCETECPEGRCCEMKHCWEVGEKLRDILLERGHQVKMGDKKYRKASTNEKASDNTKKDMAQQLAWEPDLHIAIHTNSYNETATGVRVGYPDAKYNSGEAERVEKSLKLAQCIVNENKKVYHTPSNVKTTTYNFYELNKPECPAVYIEGCFANSAKKDADWWHNNMDAIAQSYANGIETWIKQREEEENFMSYQAYVKTNYGNGASIWSDNKKSRRVEQLPDGTIVTVTGSEDSKGFVPVMHDGNKGVFDAQYLVRIETNDNEDKGEFAVNEELVNKLKEIRMMVDEAIDMADGM